MLARCPECDELVGIDATGLRQHPTRGSSTWWRVAPHPDKRTSPPKVCDGSGVFV